MFDDEDFGIFTSGAADIDGDGRVDFVEFDNDEDDFNRIMGNDNYSYDDYDADVDLLDEIDDYDTDADFSNETNDYDTDAGFSYETDDSDADDTELCNDETEFAVDSYNTITSFKATSFSSVSKIIKGKKTSLQKKYFSKYEGEYLLGDAIYDEFKEVRENFIRSKCNMFDEVIEKIYSTDKELGLKIWLWIINNFPSALTRKTEGMITQSEHLGDFIVCSFFETDKTDEDHFFFKFLSKKPELETLLFEKTYYRDVPLSLLNYISYCFENNLEKNFFRVYNGFLNNKLRVTRAAEASDVIEQIISEYYCNSSFHMPKIYYDFLMSEIAKINKPIINKTITKKLREQDECSFKYFDFDERKDEETDDYYDNEVESEEESDTNGDIDLLDDIEKLNEELSFVKSKCDTYEKQIEKLMTEIKALKSQNEPEAYFCRVCFGNSTKERGFWYKSDDTTVKVGDTVIVPFGKDNDEFSVRVVEAGYYKSSDFDFPIAKMKKIIIKILK